MLMENNSMVMALTEPAYADRVAAGWLGKCLGGLIGMPYEGVPAMPFELTPDRVVIPNVPNDDLELQLIWLTALREHGMALNAEIMGEYWRKFIPRGCDEYSIAIRNLRRGIRPPESGFHENFFTDGMGAAIRSELWAMVFAGRPELAAQFSIADASVDHWEEGVWAEILTARLEAEAFRESDLRLLLRRALAPLPENSRVRQAVADALNRYEAGTPEATARQELQCRWDHPNFTDCAMNCAYIACALLYGEGDFVRTILGAVNFARDTDCTAATCGAVLGILGGTERIPEGWRNQVQDRLALSDFVSAVPDIPRTLSELTAETVRLHERFQDVPAMPGAGQYRPFQSVIPRTKPHRWLVLAEGTCDPAELERELRQTGRCPERFREYVAATGELVFAPFPAAVDAVTVHLFTFLSAATLPETVVISATADVGMTLCLDGVRLVNHHSRRDMLPSFHRAEGGAAFAYPLEAGRRYLVHWMLYHCRSSTRAALMLGDSNNNHLDDVTMSI